MVTTFIVLMAPLMILWAQEMNEKYSMTTQMFLQEQKEKATKPLVRPRHAPIFKLSDMVVKQSPHRMIATPDTVGSVAYISCFIHLKNVNDLSELRSLGIEIEETFDRQNFITARVPVNQFEQLGTVDNVKLIKVAQKMFPLTDEARKVTNVDDLLTLPSDAALQGITTKYDGTDVVLGVIDTGIDFQHIAFKDKNGNSRIKRAYVYDGSSAQEYTTITSSSPTTDDNTGDHGTHTASIAGGSSVTVNGSTITVTDNHANATYGGMAPNADLYLAGVNGLEDTYLTNAIKKMVQYADAQNKPLVISNSWGSGIGPRRGTGELADLIASYFGDSHPNRVILFASSNDGQNVSRDGEGGGYFVKKTSATSSSPLGTIMRNAYYSDADAGCYYTGIMSTAYSSSPMNCKLYVLSNATGAVLKSWTVTSGTSTFDGLSDYYSGTLNIIKGLYDDETYALYVYSNDGLLSQSYNPTTKDDQTYYKSDYTLAIEVYPTSGSARVDMMAGTGSGTGNYNYFTNHLSTSDHTWMAGTNDMCVSNQATIPDVISVGSYMSKTSWQNYENSTYSYTVSNALGDISSFSSYATAENSPTGQAYPWITAPGAMVASGVNHYHTSTVDEDSYFHSNNKGMLIVNNASNPYGVMQGTSMATPVAAGIVALWLQAAQSVGKDLTVNDVKEIMEQTAITDIYTSGTNASHFGKGKIDALAGIKYILEDAPQIENTLYVDCIKAFAGDELTLSIKMKNVVPIRGFQFNLYLPDGITVVKNEKDRIQAFLAKDRLDEDDEHTLSVTEQNDGSLLFLCGSQYDESFTGGDGDIVSVKLSIPENMKNGNYVISLKKIKLTESDINNYYETPITSTIISVLSYITGDINGDQQVDVSDYIGVANHIHGKTPDGFVMKNADVDGSGTTDVSDYIGVANIIHTGSIYGNVLIATIKTNDASNLDEKGAKLNGTIEITNATKTFSVGFFVAENGTPSNENYIKKLVCGDNKKGDFSYTVSGLSYTTTYYYCSYILYEGVYYYGETKSFTTTKKTTYAVGDLYPADNPVGVVFYISNGGKSGKIVSLNQKRGSWFEANNYSDDYGSGWYLPSKSELLQIAAKYSLLSQYVEFGFYWSSTVYSSGVLDTLVWIVCVGTCNGYTSGWTGYNSAGTWSNPQNKSNKMLVIKSF